MKKLHITIIFIISVMCANAQDYSTVLLMGNTPLANALNPGYVLQSSYITIPSIGNISFKVSNSFSMNQIISNRTINLSEIPSKSRINVDFNVDIFNFGINIRNKGLLTFSSSIRGGSNIMYPTGIFKFIEDNDITNSEIYDVDFRSNAMVFGEFTVGYAQAINDNFSVGAKLKYLNGFASISSGETNIQLDKKMLEYGIKGDINMHIGGYDINNKDDLDISNFFDNRGVAVDIGVFYKSDDRRWSVGVSVLDIGKIRWNTGSQIKNTDPNKVYSFDGFGDLNSGFKGGVDNIVDEILGSMELDTIAVTSSKMLPTKIHAGGSYILGENRRHTFTCNFIGSINHDESYFDYSITGGYTYSLCNDGFRCMASVTHHRQRPLVYGLGILAGGYKGFQFYIMADSNFESFFNIANTSNIGFRLGMHVLIGGGKDVSIR